MSKIEYVLIVAIIAVTAAAMMMTFSTPSTVPAAALERIAKKLRTSSSAPD